MCLLLITIDYEDYKHQIKFVVWPMTIRRLLYDLAMREYTRLIATEVHLPLWRSIIINYRKKVSIGYLNVLEYSSVFLKTCCRGIGR